MSEISAVASAAAAGEGEFSAAATAASAGAGEFSAVVIAAAAGEGEFSAGVIAAPAAVSPAFGKPLVMVRPGSSASPPLRFLLTPQNFARNLSKFRHPPGRLWHP